MRTLTGTTAATQKDLPGYQPVWVVEIDADEPDVGTTTLRYASRKITISTNVYADALAKEGITLPWHRFRPWGGMAQIGGAEITQRNEEGASDIADTYALDNDAVRVGVIFSTGAETAADIVWLWRGVIEDDPRDIQEFKLTAIDVTDKRLKVIPSKIISPSDYPYAEQGLWGQGVPITIGNKTAHDPRSTLLTRSALVKAYCLDGYQGKFMFSWPIGYTAAFPFLFEYFPPENSFALVYGSTYDPDTRLFCFSDNSPDRILYLLPALPLSTNTISDWYLACNRLYDSGVVLDSSAQHLDVRMAGTAKKGEYDHALVRVEMAGTPTGSALLSIVENGVPHSVATDLEMTTSVSPSLEGDYSSNWNFETIEIKIQGQDGSSIEISSIYLDLWYKGQSSTSGISLSNYGIVSFGIIDDVANYNSGGTSNPIVYLADARLFYANHVLEALIRSRVGLDEVYDQIDKPSFATRAPFWDVPCGFQLSEQRDIGLWNEYGEAFGIHLYRSSEDKWRMTAMSYNAADYDPVATFTPTQAIAIKNPQSPVTEQVPDARIWRLSSREIVNDVVIRHEKDYMTGDYIETAAATCHYRVTGTLDTLTPTGTGDTATLVDAAADFVTDGVAVGDTCYVTGLRNLTVTAITALTTLQLLDESGDDLWPRTTVEYWVGPYTDGGMIRSAQRHKTINSLGDPVTMRDQGGKEVEFIGHLTTAQQQYYLDFFRHWRAERLYVCEFSTHLNAIHVELGDVIYFDHTRLPTWKRPYAVGTVSEDIDLTETVWTTPEAGLVDPWADVDDYLLIDDEVFKVASTSRPLGEMTVVRAQAGTLAATHASGATFYRMTHLRWMVWGMQVDVAKCQIHIEAREMPVADAPLPARVRATAVATWDTVSIEERLQGGFFSQANGLVVEENRYTGTNYISQGVGL